MTDALAPVGDRRRGACDWLILNYGIVYVKEMAQIRPKWTEDKIDMRTPATIDEALRHD